MLEKVDYGLCQGLDVPEGDKEAGSTVFHELLKNPKYPGFSSGNFAST